MAIMHCRVRTGSRSNGQSAFAHVCYITRSGKYQRLASKRGSDEAVAIGHLNMPGWAVSVPAKYWSAADEGERSNGRLFTSVEVALPRELSREQRAELALEFVRRLATEDLPTGESRPVTWAIHSDLGDHNPHLHICLSERVKDGSSLGQDEWFKHASAGAPKRPLKDKSYIPRVREIWEEMTNSALARAGSAARVDRRSYSEMGLEKMPGIHLGPAKHRALRERRQGKPAHEIARSDQALKRAAQARRAQAIRAEIAKLETQLSTMQPPIKPAVQTTTNPNGENQLSKQTNRPDSATAICWREQAEHEKWKWLDQRRRDQALAEEDELAAKRWRDQQAVDDRRAARKRQAEQEQPEIEQQLGIHQPADQAILAGGTQTEIDHAGSRYMRPAALVLAGYTARKITTKRGYEAVAYYLDSEPNRPALIDYGNQLSAYGAVTPEDHRERAVAMIEMGTQKGWNTRRFWGSEAWLRATYLEARRAGVPWSVDKQRSAYVPNAATLAAWDKEAKAEAATAEQGASDGDGTSYTTEKAVDDKTEIQAAEESKDNPYAGWSRQQMPDRLTHLRHKHGCEFEDDDEQDREGPSYGA